MIPRLCKPLLSRSFFLFGARGTGKTTLVKELLKDYSTAIFDLLDPDLYQRFKRRPGAFKEELVRLDNQIEWVLIDEIQLVPELLNLVHMFIEQKRLKFALTGSSARKLRRGGVNLLAGRALLNYLYPLSFSELGAQCDLEESLKWGGLPAVLLASDEREKKAILRTYVTTYLKEEILAEQLVREMTPFSHFLELAGQMNGERINYRKISREVNVDPKTIQSYFQIMEDTLIGLRLPAFKHSFRKQLLSAPKFYLFDVGVARASSLRLDFPVREGTYGYGRLFEHFIILELHRLNSYFCRDMRFSYLQTKDGAEIDLVVEQPGKRVTLIEIKSSRLVADEDLRHLHTIAKDLGDVEAICFAQEPRARKVNNVTIVPWQEGFRRLGLLGIKRQ